MASSFVGLQVLTPLHQAVSSNSQKLRERVDERPHARREREAPGMGHLESSQLADDLTMARDFDMGYTGPPLVIAMDFISSGLVLLVTGLASAIVLAAFTWWAPLVLVGAWASTHWLLRESAVWRDRNTDEVRDAQRARGRRPSPRHRLPAAKELRLFGARRLGRRPVHATAAARCSSCSTKRPGCASGRFVGSTRPRASSPTARSSRRSPTRSRTVASALGGATTFLQTAVEVSAIAFGGLS